MNRLILFLICVVSASCSGTAPWTEVEKAAVVEDVRAMLDNYYRDIRASGLTAEFKYLDSTSEFYWVPPGFKTSISFDRVAAILRTSAPAFSKVDNHFDTLQITPLSPDYATYTGRLISHMTDTAGQTNTYYLMETGVVVRRQNGWKLLHGQTSNIAQ